MRRADRLFQIITILRARGERRRPTRAQDIAETLEVSVRTVYRDIADLIGSGVPIDGEAGVGYLLRGGYDLPPLMFSIDEIEAIILGSKIVSSWGDPELGKAAASVLEKVEAILPPEKRRAFDETALVAPKNHHQVPVTIDIAALRRAIRSRQKITFAYVNEAQIPSKRTVRPLALAFYGPVWILVAWCELRANFRAFRIDRMQDTVFGSEPFVIEPGKGLSDYLDGLPASRGARHKDTDGAGRSKHAG